MVGAGLLGVAGGVAGLADAVEGPPSLRSAGSPMSRNRVRVNHPGFGRDSLLGSDIPWAQLSSSSLLILLGVVSLPTGAPATAPPKDDMPPSPTSSPAVTSAATVLPESPPGHVTAGLDWATADHAVAIVNDRGTVLEQFLVDATGAGLRELVRRLRRAGVGEVAIERGDGQVVDTLLDAGLTVVVISPNQVHNLRGRYGSAGNKDDRFDAFVLADTLRTDRARLRPLIPDTAATVQLRSAVRTRKDLLTHRVGLANQLRAHLRFFHPGPVGLFADLDAVTSLRFLGRFTCQDDTDWLTPSRPATWLRSVGYTGRKDPTKLHAHLLAAAPGPSGPAGAAAAAVTGAFVAALTAIVTQIHALDTHIADLLREHADAHIFLSLPRAQALRAARLLAEIGDCRARFPTRVTRLASRRDPVDTPVREDEDHLVPVVGPCCQIRVHAALVKILCRCVVRVLSGGFPVSQAS